MTSDPTPTVGRIVHYATGGGYCFAALIEATENPEGFGYPPLPDGNVHLRVFPPPFGVPENRDSQLGTPHDPRDVDGGVQCAYSTPGTWHWPERVE